MILESVVISTILFLISVSFFTLVRVLSLSFVLYDGKLQGVTLIILFLSGYSAMAPQILIPRNLVLININTYTK